jgi:hypothetical protein
MSAKGFTAGYAAAVAELVRLHGETTIAADILRASDMTLDEFTKARLDPYDMVVIRKLFAEESVLRSPEQSGQTVLAE